MSIVSSLPDKLKENNVAFDITDKSHVVKTLGVRWLSAFSYTHSKLPTKMQMYIWLDEIDVK